MIRLTKSMMRRKTGCLTRSTSTTSRGNIYDRLFLDQEENLYKPEVSEVVMDGDVEVRKFKALRRWKDGSGFCRWLRAEKSLVPGILYGKKPSGKETRMLFALPRNQIQSELKKYGRKVHNTVYDLEMEGSVQRVIVRDLQIHPVTDEPMCLNFLRYHDKTSVRVEIPIEFYNQDKSTGLRRGGQMRITMRDLDANTVKGNAPPAIPESVRLNLANTQLGQKLRAKDIPLPDGMKHNRPNDVAVTIVAKKQRGALVDEEGEAEGA